MGKIQDMISNADVGFHKAHPDKPCVVDTPSGYCMLCGQAKKPSLEERLTKLEQATAQTVASLNHISTMLQGLTDGSDE